MEIAFYIATSVLCVMVLFFLSSVRKIRLNLKKELEEKRSAIFVETGNNLTREEKIKLEKFKKDYRAGKIKTRIVE